MYNMIGSGSVTQNLAAIYVVSSWPQLIVRWSYFSTQITHHHWPQRLFVHHNLFFFRTKVLLMKCPATKFIHKEIRNINLNKSIRTTTEQSLHIQSTPMICRNNILLSPTNRRLETIYVTTYNGYLFLICFRVAQFVSQT